MDIKCYIAMTEAEIYSAPKLPQHTAWMACHFSPYGTGLTNLPRRLPENAMVILNDRIPPSGHDMVEIADTLNSINCNCYLLDFQIPKKKETEILVQYLSSQLRKPAAVSEYYSHCTNGPILAGLSPHRKVSDIIHDHSDREIWLELTTDIQMLSVYSDHTESISMNTGKQWKKYIAWDGICSRYHIELFDDHVDYYFSRTIPQIKQHLSQIDQTKITKAIALYQQFHLNLEDTK